jgi:hypothetical protein
MRQARLPTIQAWSPYPSQRRGQPWVACSLAPTSPPQACRRPEKQGHVALPRLPCPAGCRAVCRKRAHHNNALRRELLQSCGRPGKVHMTKKSNTICDKPQRSLYPLTLQHSSLQSEQGTPRTKPTTSDQPTSPGHHRRTEASTSRRRPTSHTQPQHTPKRCGST